MSNTRARAPLVWILRGPKAGDYAQLQLLARAMDVPAVTKQLVFRPWELLLHAFPRPTLAALDRAEVGRARSAVAGSRADRGTSQRTGRALDPRRVGQPLAHRSCRTTVVEPEPVRSGRVESPVSARRSRQRDRQRLAVDRSHRTGRSRPNEPLGGEVGRAAASVDRRAGRRRQRSARVHAEVGARVGRPVNARKDRRTAAACW